MNYENYAEARLYGGIFGLVFTVLLAPLFLFIYVMRLFFRAPLAAIFATFVCSAIAWVLLLLTQAISAEMSSFGAIVFMLFMCCVAASIAYGIRSFEFSAMVFDWECTVLEKCVSSFGVLGRAFYMFSQLIPGLVLLVLVVGPMLFAKEETAALTDADRIISLIVLCWFALSQFMVLRFHRTAHPVGRFVSFTGIPRNRDLSEPN